MITYSSFNELFQSLGVENQNQATGDVQNESIYDRCDSILSRYRSNTQPSDVVWDDYSNPESSAESYPVTTQEPAGSTSQDRGVPGYAMPLLFVAGSVLGGYGLFKLIQYAKRIGWERALDEVKGVIAQKSAESDVEDILNYNNYSSQG